MVDLQAGVMPQTGWNLICLSWHSMLSGPASTLRMCMQTVSGLLSVHAVLCCSSYNYSAAVDCSYKTAVVTDTECGMGGIVQAQDGKDCISEL